VDEDSIAESIHKDDDIDSIIEEDIPEEQN